MNDKLTLSECVDALESEVSKRKRALDKLTSAIGYALAILFLLTLISCFTGLGFVILQILWLIANR
ncbi:hypothetical protein AVT41_gp36 [Streptococcus phage APCM01]|uniref:hypothetical protein n=1 Tax=Streptococcus phage APCM01 TaxID=1647391 RepID=UPI00067A47FC|nr:hypothetical protein AVT41_gp36 [Streptococcus phage APCM01]AKI28597.1 hypothetical protein APCM01_036 [Streptococcus phage APCM01]